MNQNPAINSQPAGAVPPDLRAVFLAQRFRNKGTFVELKKANDGIGSIFVHEVTGDISCYHKIVNEIVGPVFGLQVPQRERHIENISSINGIATKYVDLLLKNQPEGPIRLVGWSAGAIIALEMAKQLTLMGRQPQILVIVDQVLDNASGIVSPKHSFARNTFLWLRNEPKWPLSQFVGRVSRKFLQAKSELISTASSTLQSQVHKAQELSDKAMTPEGGEFIKKLYDLACAYVPPRSYRGRVLVFIAIYAAQHLGLVNSWKSVAYNSEFCYVSGDHETLVKGAGAVEVGRRVNQVFAELPSGSKSHAMGKRWLPKFLARIFGI